MAVEDVLKAACQAFCESIGLKIRQLYEVVPKGENTDLTGQFVEELVRGFVQEWISPSVLMTGTLHPHDSNTALSAEHQNPKQIDGIAFDPRLGPAVIRQGNFIAVHPMFCPRIIEIKTSASSIESFEKRLKLIHAQYFDPFHKPRSNVMGIVIHDPDPEGHSFPEWFWVPDRAIFDYRISSLCPIFILFKQYRGEFIPYEPAIHALMGAIFGGALEIQVTPRRSNTHPGAHE